MIPVGWLAPAADCWDANMLRRLLCNELYPTGLDFRHHTGYPNTNDGCCLIIPGRFWADHTDEISSAIGRYKWVLAFRTSDEEDWFDPLKLVLPNIKWWIQTPRTDRDYGDARLFGVGFPPHFNKLTEKHRGLDAFLAGQNTHDRRNAAFEQIQKAHGNNYIVETTGFTQGLPPADYAEFMCSAKVAVCPSGAVSPDSFRLFEALEAHCVPVGDDVSPIDGPTGYFRRIFNDPPFPIIENYTDLPGWIDDILAGWPANANRIVAWWCRQKREYAQWLKADLKALGALQ
jgi:hypothetical protein